ncbi:MAG: hypothetical protein HUJ42_00885 [Malacoplasma sp.]|nr:hypothetical protein [Malacoplasma sp.]
MKLKKYKYLILFPAISAIISPIILLNNNYNQTTKASVSNQSLNATTTETTSSEPTIDPNITKPDAPNIDLSTLTPKISDLYNDYAFSSGYVIVSGSGNNTKISFYNWFKQDLWTFDFNAIKPQETQADNDTNNATDANTPTTDTNSFKTENQASVVVGGLPEGGSIQITNFQSLFGMNNGNKKIATLKVKGGLNADGTFDNKRLFVYGNFANNQGSYIFALDMTNGSIIKLGSLSDAIVSLSVQDTKAAAPVGEGLAQNAPETGNKVTGSDNPKETINSNLVSDANLLTVVDENTLIVTEARSTLNKMGDSKNPNTFNFTIINLGDANTTVTLNSDNNSVNEDGTTPAPAEDEAVNTTTGTTVTSYYNVYLVNDSSAATSPLYYFDGPIGVIKENDNLMFAIPSLTKNSSNSSSSSWDLQVWNFFYTLNSTTKVYTATQYTTAKALTGSNTTTTSFDRLTFKAGETEATIKGSDSAVNDNNAYAYLDKVVFSSEVVSNATMQKMIVSMDYDSTDLTITPSGDGTSKLMVMSLNSSAATSTSPGGNPQVFTYTIANKGTNSSTAITISGITNLVYTKDNSVAPYAVVLGKSGQKLYMGFAALNGAINVTADNNNVQLSVIDRWFQLTSNENKTSWEVGFIPSTEYTSTQDKTTTTSYFAYLVNETQQSSELKTSSYYISVSPSKAANYDVISNFSTANYKSAIQKDYQFGITDAQIADKYKVNQDLTQANIWADETTKDNLAKDLAQELYLDINGSSGAINNNQGLLTQFINYTDDLKADPVNGTITGSVSFEVNNWWNNEKSTITRNVNIQLNKESDYQINLANIDTGDRAKYVEAKYRIDGFNKQAFLQDAIDSTNIGPVLKQLFGYTQNPNVTSSIQTQAATTTVSDNKIADCLQVKQVNNIVLVTYDLTPLNIPASVIPLDQQSGELVYKNFTGKITNPSSTVFQSFEDWQKQQQSQQENTPTTATPTSTTNSNSSTSSNNGLAIATLVIAIVAVIAVVACLFFAIKTNRTHREIY